MFFLLGLGGNIRPAENLSRAIRLLALEQRSIALSRVVSTEPVDMESDLQFFNAVAWLRSEAHPTELKEWLNTVESRLGRDRSDSDRARKDRTIDVDIVFSGTQFTAADLPTESYLRPCAEHLLATIGLLPGPASPVCGLALPFGAETIGREPVRISARGREVEVSPIVPASAEALKVAP